MSSDGSLITWHYIVRGAFLVFFVASVLGLLFSIKLFRAQDESSLQTWSRMFPERISDQPFEDVQKRIRRAAIAGIVLSALVLVVTFASVVGTEAISSLLETKITQQSTASTTQGTTIQKLEKEIKAQNDRINGFSNRPAGTQNQQAFADLKAAQLRQSQALSDLERDQFHRLTIEQVNAVEAIFAGYKGDPLALRLVYEGGCGRCRDTELHIQDILNRLHWKFDVTEVIGPGSSIPPGDSVSIHTAKAEMIGNELINSASQTGISFQLQNGTQSREAFSRPLDLELVFTQGLEQ